MKKFAITPSGCGFQDGIEITEAICTMIGLSQLGASYKVFAPYFDTHSKKNHLDGSASEQRNLLVESVRITPDQITPITELNPENFDGLILIGGYGATLHLCNFVTEGAKSKVEPYIKKCIEKFHADSKPIAAFCIAPALVAQVLGTDHNITVTIGNDAEIAQEVEKTGAIHENCSVTDYISDRANKIITSPAYMYEAKPHEVLEGIQKALHEFIEMA